MTLDASEAEQVETAWSFLTPGSFIKAAKSADPAFRFALVVAGVLSIVAALDKFGTSYATLVFGFIAIIIMMVIFVIFAQIPKLRAPYLNSAAAKFVTIVLYVLVLLVTLLGSSLFFNAPLPFRSWVVAEMGLSKLESIQNSLNLLNASISQETISGCSGKKKFRSELYARTITIHTITLRSTGAKGEEKSRATVTVNGEKIISPEVITGQNTNSNGETNFPVLGSFEVSANEPFAVMISGGPDGNGKCNTLDVTLLVPVIS